MRIEYKAFTTARGGLMLVIYFNREKRYELGPFDNAQQRQATLNDFRAVVIQCGHNAARAYCPASADGN